SPPSTQPPQLSGVPETPPKANARLPSGMPVPDGQAVVFRLPISYCTPLLDDCSLFRIIPITSEPPEVAVGNTQASSDSCVVRFRLAAFGMETSSLMPSKLNACPTSPAANAVPPTSVPLLLSAESLALLSPRYQLT